MKRIAVLLPLLAGLAGPLAISNVSAAPAAPVACEVSELPWSTVSAVLKKVEDVRSYSYAELVDWYQVGLVTVDQTGSSYQVTISDEDGILEVLIIEGW